MGDTRQQPKSLMPSSRTASAEGLWYHGTPDERTWEHGGAYGIHVGTEEAARQALHARIGRPAEGEWDGTREYGKTLLDNDYRVYKANGEVQVARRPPSYPPHGPVYSGGVVGPMDARPNIFPVRITGPMTNTPQNPHGDDHANGYMRRQMAQGNARRGYYYVNQGEDAGSISAVVPSAAHLERVHPPREAAAYAPSAGIFGPTTGLDQTLFTPEGELRPGVAEDVMGRLDICLRTDSGLTGSDWQEWTRVYLLGGAVSEWSGERPNGTARDLDVIVAIDLPAAQGYGSFEDMEPGEAASELNRAFRLRFNDDHWEPSFGGTWALTAFCNQRAWDVAEIKPYAAYDLTHLRWAVVPPHLPEHSVKDFGPGVIAHAQAVVAEARAILRMDEPLRTREARLLWEHVHEHRCMAFGPEGNGWDDIGNVDEKALAYAPRDVWGKIKGLALGSKTAAQAGGPWYHGTWRHLDPGTLIKSPAARGIPELVQHEESDPEQNYFSDDKQVAGDFALLSRGMPDQARVYEVHPTGEIEVDPHPRHINSFQSRHPLRVVRQLDRSEWNRGKDEWGSEKLGDWLKPSWWAAREAAYAPRNTWGKIRELALGSKTASADSLVEVRKRGYCTDEWGRWQQGQCGTYAVALTQAKPGLRFGVAGTEDFPDSHFFAHDDTHAYDSAGRHPLPYRGVHGNLTQNDLDSDPEDFGIPDEESGPEGPGPNLAAAREHARRNRILEGGFSPRTAAQDPYRPGTPLYHGSLSQFAPGTLLTPEGTDHTGYRSRFSGEHVFMTTSPEAARYFGSMHDDSPDSDMDVHIHRVEPVGDVEPDDFPEGAEDERFARGNYKAPALRVIDSYRVPGHWARTAAAGTPGQIAMMHPRDLMQYVETYRTDDEGGRRHRQELASRFREHGYNPELHGGMSGDKHSFPVSSPIELWHEDHASYLAEGNHRVHALNDIDWDQPVPVLVKERRTQRTAAARGYLRNPYHGTEEFGGNPEWSHTWFHGTRGEPDFGTRRKYSDEAQRAALPPEQRVMNSGWTQPNQHLGVHFSPLHEVGHKFAPSTWSGPTSIAHVRLRGSNPAHFETEEHLNIAMANWASQHYPHWHDEKLNSSAAWNYSDQEGTHRDFSRVPDDPGQRWRMSSRAQSLLSFHPHMPEILAGFKAHLRAQGHHGIIYGNGVEGPYDTDATRGGDASTKAIMKHQDWPRGAPKSFSAIADPEDIEVTHVEHIAPWRKEPEGEQRTWEDVSDSDEPDEMRDKVLAWHRQHAGRLPSRLGAREEQLAGMDPRTRATALAQEQVRMYHPLLSRPLEARNGQNSPVISSWLREAGHPGAEDAYVAAHPNPGNMQSNTGRGPDGEPVVVLHPDRWDYGTAAHEVAHLITDHQTGRAFGEPHGPEGAHSPQWARNYAGLLNRISPGAAGHFMSLYRQHNPQGHQQEQAQRAAEWRSAHEPQPAPSPGLVYLSVPHGTLHALPESLEPRQVTGTGTHHVTVAHLPRTMTDAEHREVLRHAAKAAAASPPLEGTLGGMETFPRNAGPEGRRVAFVPASVPGIERLHADLSGVNASPHQEFHPHVTVGYLRKGQETPGAHPEVPVRFTHLHVEHGGKVTSFPLTGQPMQREAADRDDSRYVGIPPVGGRRPDKHRDRARAEMWQRIEDERRRAEQDEDDRYAEYEQGTLKPWAREAVSGYDGLTKRTGMIYLDLPPGTVRPVPGGVTDHHVTICYLGSDVDDEAFAEACRRAQAAAAQCPPMDGVLRGIDIFPPGKSSDGKVPAFVPAYVGGIGRLRRLLEDLSASEHTDYRPHVTLAYLGEGDSLPAPHPAVPLRFTHVYVKRGDEIRSFPLGAGIRHEASSGGSPTWADEPDDEIDEGPEVYGGMMIEHPDDTPYHDDEVMARGRGERGHIDPHSELSTIQGWLSKGTLDYLDAHREKIYDPDDPAQVLRDHATGRDILLNGNHKVTVARERNLRRPIPAMITHVNE